MPWCAAGWPSNWRDVITADRAMREAELAVMQAPYEPPAAPMVPARPPLGPGEFSTSNRGISAVKLGRKAIDAEWSVAPLFWQSAAGIAGCGIWISKGVMRAVATWKRSASGSWGTDLAYAWRTDVARFPSKLTHTELERLIR